MSLNPLYSNNSKAAERLKFVFNVMQNELHFKVLKITPLAYDEEFPFPYNNFVYQVGIEATTASLLPPQRRKPGIVPIPSGLTSLIMRLPNSESGYNNKIRVENEVAALLLAREALQVKHPNLVPRVFDWATANTAQGWILQEHMPGEPLLAAWDSLIEKDKATILGQMADILNCFQQFHLPLTIESYGGLSFNESGAVVSAPLSIFDGGPFKTYEDFMRKTIESKLAKADKDPCVTGWRQNGVRKRLDYFLTNGLHKLMSPIGNPSKTLVHADFSTDNLLFENQTMRITGVIDFDFAHIATAADEFFRSLGHAIGRFPDTRSNSQNLNALHKAMLNGFCDVGSPPADIGECDEEERNAVDWPSAKAWDVALQERNMKRPGTLPYMPELADLFWLSSQILPWKLSNEVVRRNSSTEQLNRWKKEGELSILSFLEDYNF